MLIHAAPLGLRALRSYLTHSLALWAWSLYNFAGCRASEAGDIPVAHSAKLWVRSSKSPQSPCSGRHKCFNPKHAARRICADSQSRFSDLRICPHRSFRFRLSREIANRFGARIRELRLARKMRQVDLAERVGIQEAYVSSIESGKKEPCLQVIEMLADGLGVSLRNYFGICDVRISPHSTPPLF